MPIVARPYSATSAAILVAKYARVSTPNQLDGFGLEDQEKISDGWLACHPEATVYDSYVDKAVSGSLESRPEMDRLVRDAHRLRFNRILVPAVDRIGRTARAAYQWAWDMADIGVSFISAREGIDTSTEEGWQHFMQHVNFSEMEWRRIKERTVAGRELKISYGGWPGGPAPYGYRIEHDTSYEGPRRKRFSALVTDAHEAMVLDRGVRLIVDDGMNISEACAELNKRKLHTRNGVRWTPANLRNRLHSETIHDGYVVYRKTNRGSAKNTTLRHDDGTPVHGEQVRIGVPPIFSEERAGQLMTALKSLGFQKDRQSNRVYSLTGRIHGHCGEVYTGCGTSRAYRCKGTLTDPSCREPYFGADDIGGAVWAELPRLLTADGPLGEFAARWGAGLARSREKYEKRVTDLAARITAQEHLIEVRVPEYVRAGVAPAVPKASVTQLQQELDEFRLQRKIAEEWLEDYAHHERRAHNLLDIANGAMERLRTLTLAERKEVFDMFDLHVVPGDMTDVGKPGNRCPVSEWHWETGALVPPDPTDEEWETVLSVLRLHFSGKAKKHFVTKYDIREQFCGMLHRLRHGVSWVDMPNTWGPMNPMRERQLTWWKRGVWPELMAVSGADERGSQAYRRPTLPRLTVTGRLRAGMLTQIWSEEPR
ncbi:recombinase family protein [Streptomyces sp. NBC_01283]|uniref:recombinase family protein n=1 Tax=Streptomyces sp. NBC_01283 TaxID=2903812 RepID=UPI00352F098D|nr:recombinase family protein [Streptomyces sp. NBC_01283]